MLHRKVMMLLTLFLMRDGKELLLHGLLLIPFLPLDLKHLELRLKQIKIIQFILSLSDAVDLLHLEATGPGHILIKIINQRLSLDVIQQLALRRMIGAEKTAMADTCYECKSKENIKICSEYTAICQKCYDVQAEEARYYKAMREKDPEIDYVDDGVYLGNEDAATTEEVLDKHGITAICSCGALLDQPFKDNPKYRYKLYEIDDFPKQPIKQYFEDHYTWMQEMKGQGRKILVHCAAGISRSASFTIAYFMRKRGTGFQATKNFVKSKRKYICPNSGFRQQLAEFQSELIQKKIIKLE